MSRPTEITIPASRFPSLPPRKPVPEPGSSPGAPAAGPELGATELPVVIPAAETPPNDAAKQGQPSRRSPSSPPPPYRDFIIRYAGQFIGHYRSASRITNRTALRHIARQLRERWGDEFDPAQLELFRPVKLECPLPDDLDGAASGSFEWFGG